MNSKIKMMGLVITLITILCLSIIPTQADDVDKLIRIKPDDSWMYEKNDEKGVSNDTYIVTSMDIINDKELNLIDTNSTGLDYFTADWTNGLYGFTTKVDAFTLYNDARGNFLGLVQGTDTLYLNTPSGTLIIPRSGTLWERTSTESVNQAIVTGEPRTVVYEYHKNNVWSEDGQERKEIIDIILQYIAYPHDEQPIEYEKTPTTAINITFSLDEVRLVCDFNNGTIDIGFDQTFEYSYLEYDKYVTYTYANQIGLPVEIEVLNKLEPIGIGATLDTIHTEIERSIKLVNYDINEANLTTTEPSSTSHTTSEDAPFSIIGIFIATLVLIWDKRWKTHE